MTKSNKLVFFGSGPVAADSLKLLAQNFEIEAVITKPKPLHHKGDFPVLTVAANLNLPVLTVEDKQELNDLFKKTPVKSPAGVLIDFGIIISQEVIDYFPLGIVNSHFSVLPEWRGADPITFAILSGQSKTGVSLMLLVPAMDEGPLLAYAEYDMSKNITTPILTKDLIALSNSLLIEVLPKYFEQKISSVDQSATGKKISYSRKLTKADGLLDFNKPAEILEREVRAYQGWPKSRTKINGFDVVVIKARLAKDRHDGDLVIQCSPGWLEIQELTAPSGRNMSAAAFLRGYSKPR